MVSAGKSSRCSQQDFLRDAMGRLGMTRDEFAAHVCVANRTLHKWLLPSDSTDFRVLPESGREYIARVLAREAGSGPGHSGERRRCEQYVSSA
jgi:hypothetical protein